MPGPRSANTADQDATGMPAEKRQCLHHLFEAQARQRPDAVAVSCGPVAVTYGAAQRAGKSSRSRIDIRRSAS